MTERVADFLRKAAEKRQGRLTAEQARARRRVAAHTEAISRGVKRGPNAPKDGTFGGIKKS